MSHKCLDRCFTFLFCFLHRSLRPTRLLFRHICRLSFGATSAAIATGIAIPPTLALSLLTFKWEVASRTFSVSIRRAAAIKIMPHFSTYPTLNTGGEEGRQRDRTIPNTSRFAATTKSGVTAVADLTQRGVAAAANTTAAAVAAVDFGGNKQTK